MNEELNPLYYWQRKQRLSRDSATTCDRLGLLLRWGTTYKPDLEFVTEFNVARAVALTSNKGRCREVLNRAGVAVPTPVNLNSIQPDDYPFIVRPMFHQKGRGFLLFNNQYEFTSAMRNGSVPLTESYASRVYRKTAEYRVHVGHGKVLVVQQKLQTSDYQTGVTGDSTSNWNHDNGFVFTTVGWKSFRDDIVKLAVQAMNVVGLDYGAVDIMADSTDLRQPRVVVCEINTAPKLEGYTATRYAEYFDWIIRTGETRHFDIPDGTQARHYVFKHRELTECDYDFEFKEVN